MTPLESTLNRPLPSAAPGREAFPLVSVGLPVYNGERYIAKALEALCAQDYPNFEIIISENASKDATYAICRQYAERYAFIRLHRQPQHVGVQKNFLTALEAARGRYFFWAGMDDFWQPSFTRTLVEELEKHSEAQLAMTAFERVYDDGTVYDVQRFTGKDSPNGKGPLDLLFAVTSPAKYNLFLYGLFRTDFIRRAVRHFPEIPAWDRVFMCAIVLATPVRYVDEVLHGHGLNTVPVQNRYPQEAIFHKKGKAYRFLFLNTVRAIITTVLDADIIPRHRKLYLVPGILHYIWVVCDNRLRVSTKRLITGCYHLLDPLRSRVKSRLLKLDARLAQPRELRTLERRLCRLERHFWGAFRLAGKASFVFLKTLFWSPQRRKPSVKGSSAA